MSFDVNIGRSEPIIKAAANMNNDGGSGGNTGYMMSGGRKKKEERRSLFSMKDGMDTYDGHRIHSGEDIPLPDENSILKSFLKKFF